MFTLREAGRNAAKVPSHWREGAVGGWVCNGSAGYGMLDGTGPSMTVQLMRNSRFRACAEVSGLQLISTLQLPATITAGIVYRSCGGERGLGWG
jgi:hypothetical protein